MARDEAEEERDFLADLVPRTGRDLGQWMAAISAQGFTDKNETIDWLRAQGFPFARASWLERIHSNGGRPIYLQGPPAPVPLPAMAADVPHTPLEPPAAPAKPKPVAEVKPPSHGRGDPAVTARSLEALVAAAKGYRPLYQLLENMIRQAVPGVSVEAKGQLVSFAAPHEFAVVQPTSSEIRLGLGLGTRPHDANLVVPRMKGAGPGITHMLTLKDARQINAELQALILAALAEAR